MKKIKKSIILFLGFITLSISCDTDEVFTHTDIGASPIQKTKQITPFDIDSPINFNFLTANGVTVSSSKVTFNKKEKDLTIAENKGSFSSAFFGNLKIDSVYAFSLRSEFSNGNYVEDFEHTVKVIKSSKVSPSDFFELERNIKPGKKVDTISYSNPTSSAEVNSLVTEWKKNHNGSYTSFENNFEDKEYDFSLSNFEYMNAPYNAIVKDTIYIRFIAQSGVIKDTLVSKIAILPQTFSVSKSGKISDYGDSYRLNLKTGKTFANGQTDDNEPAEVEYDSNTIKAVDSSIEFVLVGSYNSDEVKAFYDDAGLYAVKEKYDAGTSVATVSLANILNVYTYKITRLVKNKDKVLVPKDFYGKLLYKSYKKVVTSKGSAKDYNIEWKEGIPKNEY